MDLGKRGGDLVVGEGRETVVVVYCIGKEFILNKKRKNKRTVLLFLFSFVSDLLISITFYPTMKTTQQLLLEKRTTMLIFLNYIT